MEHVLRQCLVALRLAERAGVEEEGRAAVYYTSLLIGVGCHTDAHEQAKWFGDDLALKATKYDHPMPSVAGAAATMRRLGAGSPPLHRFRIGLEFAISGHREVDAMIEHHAGMGRALGAELGLPPAVLDAIAAAYERWDGCGWPGALAGERVPLPSRIAQIAEFLEVAHRVGGVGAAQELARDRRATQFDPALADLVLADGELLLDGLDAIDTWQAVIAGEPALGVVLSDERLDEALEAIAGFVDLKSPYFLGHAAAVAELVAAAGDRLGLGADEVTTLRRSGLAHDLGRLGISNAILDKRGALSGGESERIRLQPYVTERMLRQSDALAPLGAIALAHHERLDGSGHPHGLRGAQIPQSARLLGAADAYQAMREPRPHRPPLTAAEAAATLRAEVRAGRLDAEACEAVLGAAGHRVPRRRTGPAGLTPREVEILREVARGRSTREIAAQLVISPKTVRNHVEHIYAKIGATSRAAAALYALQHGLLPEEELAAPAP